MKFKLIFFLLIFGISSLYAQKADDYIVSSNNVRLRESPSLGGKILRLLSENEFVQYIKKDISVNNTDYAWIYVKTNNGNGWVYGEYLKKRITDNASIEANSISFKKESILSGMTEKDVINKLGKPQKLNFDEEYQEYTYEYQNGNFILLISKHNMRVNHIVIKEFDVYINDCRIGSEIFLTEIFGLLTRNGDNYSINLSNKLRPECYDCSIIFQVNSENRIIEIQAGAPGI